MDDDRTEIPDGIEQGKRLVRAGGGAGVSLGDRLLGRLYRFAWRTPFHALKLRGRHPLKLMTVPADPIAGDERAAFALASGELAWMGERIGIEDGWQTAPLGENLAIRAHGFATLRDLALLPDRAEATKLAETLVRQWLSVHGESITEPAWRPDIAARRVFFWAAYAPLILSSTDLVYRSAVLNHLARVARHLDRTADRSPVGTQRIIAWCGVIASGLLIAGNEPRRLFGEAGLEKALAGGLFGDGGIPSRSPENLLNLVDVLAMLGKVYEARKMVAPEIVGEAADRATCAVLGVTLGDGGLSSWQGGMPVSAARVQTVTRAASPKGRPLRQAREWGYQRLNAGDTVIICDAAPPPLSSLTGLGCASTLAFEMSDGTQRLVVNCGGARSGVLTGRRELVEGLRTSAAHSTLILADSNSTALQGSGQLGKGVAEVEIERMNGDGSSRIEASHDGYARRFGFVHRRTMALSSDGREVRGEDTLLPHGKAKKTKAAAYAVRFHLAPQVEASSTADGMGALLRLGAGPLWQFRTRGGALSIEESLWISPDGIPQSTTQLVIQGEAAAGGAAIGWVFKRAG